MQDHDKDYDNFEKRYKDEVSQIRAPRDLVERTRTAMQAEASTFCRNEKEPDQMAEDQNRKKKQYMRRWIPAIAAACICIVILGVYGGYRYYAGNHINVGDIVLSQSDDNGWEIGVELGRMDPKQEEDSPVQIVSGNERSIAPKQLWEIKPSMIEGQEVHIGTDQNKGTYYAAWEKEGTYYYASSNSTKEEKFLDYLKENIKKL